MKDQFGREIDYLRISVTDRCNFRCKYCMPEGGIDAVPMEEILHLEEIATIAKAAAKIGIRHLKITGGEPLVRKDIVYLIRLLKSIDGIDKVTLTTNGYLLKENLPALHEAGIDGINISLDTADKAQFAEITGVDALDRVLEAVRMSCKMGIRTKINAVSLNFGEETIKSLIELAKEMPVDVRFIEMMPIGTGKTFSTYGVIDHRILMDFLQEKYPGMTADHSFHGYGPAVYYHLPGYQGSIGLISALHGKFCNYCNRVRLTAQGYLKTCLCYNDGADLKPILREEHYQEEKLIQVMADAIYRKPGAHCFEEMDKITEEAGMNAIGG